MLAPNADVKPTPTPTPNANANANANAQEMMELSIAMPLGSIPLWQWAGGSHANNNIGHSVGTPLLRQGLGIWIERDVLRETFQATVSCTAVACAAGAFEATTHMDAWAYGMTLYNIESGCVP